MLKHLLQKVLFNSQSVLSDEKTYITCADIKAAPRYLIKTYDKTDSLSFDYANIYLMPDGNLYYFNLFSSKDSLFDVNGELTESDDAKLIGLYKLDGEVIGKSDVFVKDDVEGVKIKQLFGRILKTIFTGKY